MSASGQNLVIIYDGACEFCRRRAEWLRRRNRAACFEFLPIATPNLHERFPQLRGLDTAGAMSAIAPDGRIWTGADAVYAIARRLPRWRHIALLYRLPPLKPLFRFLYRWIARHRYRLAGRCENGSCAIDSKDPRSSNFAAPVASQELRPPANR